MVPHNRIEGQSCREDVVCVLAIDAIGSWVKIQGGVLIDISILLDQGFKVFVHPFIGCILYGYFCIIVILGLGVGQVAQVAKEEVIVIHADFKHFFESARVISDVAVATHQEGILLDGVGQIFIPSDL